VRYAPPRQSVGRDGSRSHEDGPWPTAPSRSPSFTCWGFQKRGKERSNPRFLQGACRRRSALRPTRLTCPIIVGQAKRSFSRRSTEALCVGGLGAVTAAITSASFGTQPGSRMCRRCDYILGDAHACANLCAIPPPDPAGPARSRTDRIVSTGVMLPATQRSPPPLPATMPNREPVTGRSRHARQPAYARRAHTSGSGRRRKGAVDYEISLIGDEGRVPLPAELDSPCTRLACMASISACRQSP